MYGPNDRLVLGASRVEGGNTGSFIVVKYLFITAGTTAAGTEQNSAKKDRKKYNFNFHT